MAAPAPRRLWSGRRKAAGEQFEEARVRTRRRQPDPNAGGPFDDAGGLTRVMNILGIQPLMAAMRA